MARNLLEPKDTYVIEYPEAIEFIDKQLKVFWFPEEINVEKDVQDIRVHLSDAERHGVITTLKLFTQYELIVGDEYWGQLGKWINKPACISRMANLYGCVELNVHAPFYSKINEALGLANDEFYTEYLNDPVLSQRIAMLENYTTTGDLRTFLAALAFAEGVILYSSFAFLKHFQSQGKNKILNIVRGINFSARDEGLHSQASAWMYRTLHEESGIAPAEQDVLEMAEIVRQHEYAIIDKIFARGPIEGVTDIQMKHFVDSRINVVLRDLGFKDHYDVKYNPIGDWFYKGMNDYIMNDFFTGQGREYKRDWNEEALRW